MRLKNRYLTVSIITASAAATVTAAVLLLAPAEIELILYWTQLGCLLSAFGCILDCVRKDSTDLFLQLNVGAIACFVLGLVFWVTHLTVLGYDDQTISISDISVIGFYLFLITAVTGIPGKEMQRGNRAPLKYTVIAFVAPAFVTAVGALQLIFIMKNSPGNVVYDVLYTAVMAPLSFLSLRLLIVPAEGSPRIKAMRLYNFVVISIVIVNVVWNVCDFIDHSGIGFCVSVFLTSMLQLLIVPAAYGGYKKWKTC